MAAATILLPDAPCLVVAYGHAVILSGDGELMTLTINEARHALKPLPPPLVIHAPSVQKRLGLSLPVLDVLELFAFARPAQNCAPTPLPTGNIKSTTNQNGIESTRLLFNN